MNARRLVLGLGVAAALVLASVGSVPARAMGTTPDPLQAKQWSLGQINAPAAWTVSTGRGVTIGIVDTGIDLAHEDFAAEGGAVKIVATADCIGSGGDVNKCKDGGGQDDNGHGTHVSGIAAADTGNGKGIAGVAPDAKLVVAKALDANGSGGTDDINAAIAWVVKHGATVVNLSLGGNEVVNAVLGNPLENGVEYAWNNGAIPVLAAGNGRILLYGGSQNYGNLDAVVVGATGPDGKVATSYSSDLGNAKWGLVAPGGEGSADADHEVLSTFWDGKTKNAYGVEEGTSMATPHVSGALALLRAQGLTQQQAVDRLLATADKTVSCGTNCKGRLDVAKAVGSGTTAASTATTVAPGGSGSANASSSGSSNGSGSGSGTAAGPSTSARAGGATTSTAVKASSAAKTPATVATSSGPAGATAAPAADLAPSPGGPTGSAAVASSGGAVSASHKHGRSTGTVILAIVGVLLLVAVATGLAARRWGVRAGAAR